MALTPDQNLSWNRKIHQQKGNIVLTDGSVSSLLSSEISGAAARTGMTTNYLLFP